MLLTIDIGTSNFKSAVWDYNGKLISLSAFPLSTDERDCSVWLRAFEYCRKELGALSAVEAIVISGNGPTLVPVTGQPLIEHGNLSVPANNARLWIDRKADKYQEKVSEIMGGFVDAGFFLPKILRIKHEENDLYKRVKYFLGCPEYLGFALTGEARTVFPSQGFDRWFWNENVLEKLDLDPEKFPPFINPGEMIGKIIPRAAELFGFKKEIPVISGGPDFFAAILGCGVMEPSHACDRSGSSEGINLCTQNHINDARLMSYGHPVKPYWNLSGIINTTGRAVEWAEEILGISDHEEFFSLAKRSQAGSGGLVFLPYLAGERAPVWDSSVRGLWHGISLSTARSEIANSILEGICFAIKDVVSVMEETGENVEHLRVTGGMAGNSFLNQKKADITGKEILEPVYKEAELLGCAVIGACYLGKYGSFKEAVNAMVNIEKHYEPNPENSCIYNSLFEEYIAQRQRL
jgi:xylulokinase